MRGWMKARRKELGLTQEQLSAETGYSAAYLSMIENGVKQKSMDLTCAARLAFGLKMTVHDIILAEMAKE